MGTVRLEPFKIDRLISLDNATDNDYLMAHIRASITYSYLSDKEMTNESLCSGGRAVYTVHCAGYSIYIS